MQISEAPDEHGLGTLRAEAVAEKMVSQKINAERIASEALGPQPYLWSPQYSSVWVRVSTFPDTHPTSLL